MLKAWDVDFHILFRHITFINKDHFVASGRTPLELGEVEVISISHAEVFEEADIEESVYDLGIPEAKTESIFVLIKDLGVQIRLQGSSAHEFHHRARLKFPIFSEVEFIACIQVVMDRGGIEFRRCFEIPLLAFDPILQQIRCGKPYIEAILIVIGPKAEVRDHHVGGILLELWILFIVDLQLTEITLHHDQVSRQPERKETCIAHLELVSIIDPDIGETIDADPIVKGGQADRALGLSDRHVEIDTLEGRGPIESDPLLFV